jgi:signal transduction histidine kinase
MVAASTLVGMLVAPRWGNSPVDLLYLPAVLAAAGFYGLGPGVLAAVTSALAFNYFFAEPLRTFRIANAEDVATVALLFLVALVTSQLAARIRSGARAAKASASRNATIAGLARHLLSCSNDEQIAQIACRELGRLFESNTVLMAAGPEPHVVAARPSHGLLTPSDIAVAAWAMESGKPAGRGAAAVSATEWVFYPVRSGTAVLGALGLARDDGTRPVPDGQLDLLNNLIDQVALALERSRLEAEARGAEKLRERNRLRSALLATIGQDIEPRLSGITGGLNALRRGGSSEKTAVSAIGTEVTKLRRYLSSPARPRARIRPAAGRRWRCDNRPFPARRVQKRRGGPSHPEGIFGTRRARQISRSRAYPCASASHRLGAGAGASARLPARRDARTTAKVGGRAVPATAHPQRARRWLPISCRTVANVCFGSDADSRKFGQRHAQALASLGEQLW